MVSELSAFWLTFSELFVNFENVFIICSLRISTVYFNKVLIDYFNPLVPY